MGGAHGSYCRQYYYLILAQQESRIAFPKISKMYGKKVRVKPMNAKCIEGLGIDGKNLSPLALACLRKIDRKYTRVIIDKRLTHRQSEVIFAPLVSAVGDEDVGPSVQCYDEMESPLGNDVRWG